MAARRRECDCKTVAALSNCFFRSAASFILSSSLDFCARFRSRLDLPALAANRTIDGGFSED